MFKLQQSATKMPINTVVIEIVTVRVTVIEYYLKRNRQTGQ